MILAKYRLAPASKLPAQIKELNDQIEAATKLKNKNCASKNIYLLGHSAGAHMIAYWSSEHSNQPVGSVDYLVKLVKTWLIIILNF